MDAVPDCILEFEREPTHYGVVGLDFTSLYPSIIMAQNFSRETIICDPMQAQRASKFVKLNPIEFTYGDSKIKAWAIAHENDPAKFGILPKVLKMLFDKRSAVKKQYTNLIKQIEEAQARGAESSVIEDLEFQLSCAYSEQISLKLVANSAYGVAGGKISPIYLLQLAAGVTSFGQFALKSSIKVTENLNCKVYYGDSVIGSTPVLLRSTITGMISIMPIESVGAHWKHWHDCKEQSTCDFEVWSNGKWTAIKRIIRHFTNKPIYQVCTPSGCICVTCDHSLVKDGTFECVKPAQIKLGTMLLHSFPSLQMLPEISENFQDLKLPPISASDVPTSTTDTTSTQLSWDSNKLSLCMACMFGTFMQLGYADVDLKLWILRVAHAQFDIVYRYICMMYNLHNFKVTTYEKYSTITANDDAAEELAKFYTQHCMIPGHYKVVPTEILNAPFRIKKAYMDGYLQSSSRFSCRGVIGAQGLYLLASVVGLHVTVKVEPDSNGVIFTFRVVTDTNDSKLGKNLINLHAVESVKMVKLQHALDFNFNNCAKIPSNIQCVYDLETESGYFQAGVGSLVAHNTDSQYLEPPAHHFTHLDAQYYGGLITKPEYCAQVVQITQQVMPIIRDAVNAHFHTLTGGNFLRMAYEEVNFFFALLGKKNYYAKAHVDLANFKGWIDNINVDISSEELQQLLKQLFIKGAGIKKRGVSAFAKRVIGYIMAQSMVISNTKTLLELVESAVHRVYNSRNYNIEDFVATDQYKPDRNNVKVKSFVKRMEECGIAIQPYNRYKYIIAKKYPFVYDQRGRKQALKVGDMVELYEVAKNEGLEINLDYYMDGSVNGMLTRFVANDPRFNTPSVAPDEFEDLAMSAAKKFIVELCAKYRVTPVSKGLLYRGAYRKAEKLVTQALERHQVISGDLQSILKSDWDVNNFDQWLLKKALSVATEDAKEYAKWYINSHLKRCKDAKKNPTNLPIASAKELLNIYIKKHTGRVDKVNFHVEKQLWDVCAEIRKNMATISRFYNAQNEIIVGVLDTVKTILDIDNIKLSMPMKYAELEGRIDRSSHVKLAGLKSVAIEKIDDLMSKPKIQSSLLAIHNAWIELLALLKYRERVNAIAEQLKHVRVVQRQPSMAVAAGAASITIRF